MFTQMSICFMERSCIQKLQRSRMFHPQASKLIQFYDALKDTYIISLLSIKCLLLKSSSIMLHIKEFGPLLKVSQTILAKYPSIRLFIHVWYPLFWEVGPLFYNMTLKEWNYGQDISLCLYHRPLIKLYFWRVTLYIIDQCNLYKACNNDHVFS